MTNAVGNDTTASDWMSEGGEVVIAVIGASKSKTEAFVNGLGSTECDIKCREEDDIFLTMCDVPGHWVGQLLTAKLASKIGIAHESNQDETSVSDTWNGAA